MKLCIDECISPSLSRYLNAGGAHDCVHLRDRGRLRDPDHAVFAWAIEQDRVLVTENAEDFRKLARRVELHPGLIVLPSVGRARAQQLMLMALAFLDREGGERPQDLLVNSVLTVSAAGEIRLERLP